MFLIKYINVNEEIYFLTQKKKRVKDTRMGQAACWFVRFAFGNWNYSLYPQVLNRVGLIILAPSNTVLNNFK